MRQRSAMTGGCGVRWMRWGEGLVAMRPGFGGFVADWGQPLLSCALLPPGRTAFRWVRWDPGQIRLETTLRMLPETMGIHHPHQPESPFLRFHSDSRGGSAGFIRRDQGARYGAMERALRSPASSRPSTWSSFSGQTESSGKPGSLRGGTDPSTRGAIGKPG